MTLLFPKTPQEIDAARGQPGLHVFIAGVSYYAHLPGGKGTPGPSDFGMKQLSAAASSAYRICDWILEHRDRFPLPLDSCRLLISPVDDEIKAQSVLGSIDRCTLQNFISTADELREDASHCRESMVLVYFAGHGIQQSGNDAVLLLEDFNAPGGDRLRNAVDINNILAGMSPSSQRLNMARTQLYFIDSCRVRPKEVQKFPSMKTTSVFDVSFDVESDDENEASVIIDDRRAPIFYAAVPGDAAYSRTGQFTYFSQALLTCLTGRAGVKVEDPYGQKRWQVFTNSLSAALEVVLEEVRQRYGMPLSHRVGGIGSDALILNLKEPPQANVKLEIDPMDAYRVARVEVIDEQQSVVWQLPSPLHPYPCDGVLMPGEYTINVSIDPETEPFVNVSGERRRATPPLSRWIIRVVG